MATNSKAKYLRITKKEEEMLKEAYRKINNELLKNNHVLLTESQILHQALELSLGKMEADSLGRISIK